MTKQERQKNAIPPLHFQFIGADGVTVHVVDLEYRPTIRHHRIGKPRRGFSCYITVFPGLVTNRGEEARPYELRPGCSFYNPEDVSLDLPFDHRIGRKVAFARTVSQIEDKATRRQGWIAYREAAFPKKAKRAGGEEAHG